MIALLRALVTPGADIHHDARAFMAEDRRKQPFRIGAGTGEFVGVADAGSLDLDQHLAGLRPFELDVFDDKRFARLIGQRRLWSSWQSFHKWHVGE